MGEITITYLFMSVPTNYGRNHYSRVLQICGSLLLLICMSALPITYSWVLRIWAKSLLFIHECSEYGWHHYLFMRAPNKGEIITYSWVLWIWAKSHLVFISPPNMGEMLLQSMSATNIGNLTILFLCMSAPNIFHSEWFLVRIKHMT